MDKSLPNNKILDWLKAFAHNKINKIENEICFGSG